MRWPWRKHHRPDPSILAREHELEAKTQAAEQQAQAAIEQARQARARAGRHIRENHIAPRIAAAFKESR